ncbi:uncharacterized protein LOC124846042 [Vigna umbellata]|uniref:uncharacterized protein LOC124846042 n=1 Tax=Vigna umbellata TaxID=87088 RepID=UPI001F5E9842|nr:uncharacterized protein LOC124846042 [Vigna umbellata]
MKRKSKMKKGSHPSFKVINTEGEDKAIEGDPEIRILTRPFAFRVPAILVLLLLFIYCILALAEALSGYGVALGSTEVPALMFVCGGAIGAMLLMGSIIMVLKSVFKNQIPSKIG